MCTACPSVVLQGSFFRDFMLDELVKSIDALSREQAVGLLVRLGVPAGVRLPLLLPGAKAMSVPLAPTLTEEDRKVVENITKMLNFLSRGSASGGDASLVGAGSGFGAAFGSAEGAAVLTELMPVLPSVATEVVPQVVQRLISRVTARTVRDIFV